jgi:methylated-DNA-[protein]-cysteine S-methyltransferase
MVNSSLQKTKDLWTASACYSGFGWVSVAASGIGLCHLAMQADPQVFRVRYHSSTADQSSMAAQIAAEALRQLDAYFAGQLQTFDLPIDWETMRPFQQQVLRLAASIPFGQVRTYGEIAIVLGGAGHARAVGHALATNPIGIILPCHRVVGADGGLHGFSAAGGLATKAWLLRLEGHTLDGERVQSPDAVRQPFLPGLFDPIPPST